VADRDEPEASRSEWHGDGTVGEDDDGSGQAATAPPGAMGEAHPGGARTQRGTEREDPPARTDFAPARCMLAWGLPAEGALSTMRSWTCP
jgi:hypothetical protein